MNLQRPQKTLADFMVIGISPVLIMFLVGSLCFFLIQVFYRGQMVSGVRWVMFWFVIAIVLVSRIGIEQSSGHAFVYGLALAVVTWLFLVRTQPVYLLGVILLGVVWYCAHKLTWDCTLIDDEQDASDIGLLQAAQVRKGKAEKEPVANEKRKLAGPSRTAIERKKQTAPVHRPGIWVVYFSLGALPLFGIGQTLLPGNINSRRIGLIYLLVYLAAALGLLLTTGFLGLRRYLRRRLLRMPGNVAFGWIKFGVGVATIVLLLAMLLPRPGAFYVWKSLGYRIDYTLRKASEYASRANPPGSGTGRPGNQGNETGEQNGSGGKAQSKAERNQGANVGQRNSAEHGQAKTGQGQSAQSGPTSISPAPPPDLYYLFRVLFYLVVVLILGWWAFRQRHLILEVLRSLIAAIKRFFQTLFGFGPSSRRAKSTEKKTKKTKPVIYQNPFLTGADKVWPPEHLVLYSFEAIEAWAEVQGVARKPQQTAHEFCVDLSEKYPEVATGLDQLSFLYGHAAYGIRLPGNCDVEPLRLLWRYVTESQSLSVATAEVAA